MNIRIKTTIYLFKKNNTCVSCIPFRLCILESLFVSPFVCLTVFLFVCLISLFFFLSFLSLCLITQKTDMLPSRKQLYFTRNCYSALPKLLYYLRVQFFCIFITSGYEIQTASCQAKGNSTQKFNVSGKRLRFAFNSYILQFFD